MKIFLAFVLAFSFEVAEAQSPDLLEEKLTNGSHQKWKLTEIDGGSENVFCKDQIYDFQLKNKTLYRSICDKKEVLNWVITSDDYKKYITLSKADNQMKIVYEIQFVRKNNTVLLRLRIADLKNFKQTTDYYFDEMKIDDF